MNKIIVLVGQTAVGKTSLSIKLAKAIDGEIINGDAFQVYKGLDIVTAKIKNNEKENIPHHLFDIKNIDENYNVDEYQRNIRKVIDDILKRNKTPIIVGGTGLYIKAALYDYQFENENIDHKQIDEKYKSYTNEQLYERLKEIDPKSCENIHQNNRRRVIRAIEIFENTGKTKSENIEKQSHNMLYDAIIFGLYLPHDKLLENINNRVEEMFNNNVMDEIKNNPTTSTASKAIGYKEIQDYLDNKIDLEETKQLIKIHTRQFAKRQMTWFKHQMDVIWIENNQDALDNILDNINKAK